MGYLPGDVRIMYEEEVCVGCLHAGDMETYFCPVMQAHTLSNDVDQPMVRRVLFCIIPEAAPGDHNEVAGLKNAKCLMWTPAPASTRLSGF